jgi:hypothetical protein
MQGRYITNVTPQSKAVNVNNKFGNTNIKNQQGTTRVLFDTLPLDGRTEFRFFENSNTRTLPYTNLTADGNRLQVGETFVIQKIYFQILNINATNQITAAWSFGGGGPINSAALTTGELDFVIANSQVIKSLSAAVFTSFFNPTSVKATDEAYGTQTDIVIPPLLEFIAILKTTSYATFAPNASHLQILIEGTSGILAPQTTF